MIEAKNTQSKKQRKPTITQLNTIKQIYNYNRHCHMNDITKQANYRFLTKENSQLVSGVAKNFHKIPKNSLRL